MRKPPPNLETLWPQTSIPSCLGVNKLFLISEEQLAELEEHGRKAEEGMRKQGLDPNSIEDLKPYMEFKETEARLETRLQAAEN